MGFSSISWIALLGLPYMPAGCQILPCCWTLEQDALDTGFCGCRLPFEPNIVGTYGCFLACLSASRVCQRVTNLLYGYANWLVLCWTVLPYSLGCSPSWTYLMDWNRPYLDICCCLDNICWNACLCAWNTARLEQVPCSLPHGCCLPAWCLPCFLAPGCSGAGWNKTGYTARVLGACI